MPRLEGFPDEAGIRAMVDTFYERVRDDSVLAPVFESHVSNWDTHLDTMTAFWTNVLLGRPGFVGDPVGKHRAMSELRPHHFDRWLALFGEVVDGLFEEPVAANIHGRASRMRLVLERPREPASP